jgi:hypothetical protein
MVKTAKSVHDQKLEQWGDRTEAHSTNILPYANISPAKRKKLIQAADKRKKGIQAGKESMLESMFQIRFLLNIGEQVTVNPCTS